MSETNRMKDANGIMNAEVENIVSTDPRGDRAVDAAEAEKPADVTVLPEKLLSSVTGGLRSMDWRRCSACGYFGGSWSFVDGNRNLKCPNCGEKQSAW